MLVLMERSVFVANGEIQARQVQAFLEAAGIDRSIAPGGGCSTTAAGVHAARRTTRPAGFTSADHQQSGTVMFSLPRWSFSS